MSPQVASPEEWLAARKELRIQEGELLKLRDAVNEARRALPMVPVDKDYVFEGPTGEVSLLDLFEGRNAEDLDRWLERRPDEWKAPGSPRRPYVTRTPWATTPPSPAPARAGAARTASRTRRRGSE